MNMLKLNLKNDISVQEIHLIKMSQREKISSIITEGDI